MKFPKTLKVGGHRIKLELTEQMIEGNAGMWEPGKNLISLWRGQPASQMEVTLLHELIHSVAITLEHNQVEMLSQLLYQIIKDNKLYFDGKK